MGVIICWVSYRTHCLDIPDVRTGMYVAGGVSTHIYTYHRGIGHTTMMSSCWEGGAVSVLCIMLGKVGWLQLWTGIHSCDSFSPQPPALDPLTTSETPSLLPRSTIAVTHSRAVGLLQVLISIAATGSSNWFLLGHMGQSVLSFHSL